MGLIRGRNRELEDLEESIVGALGGAGSVTTVEGPPGIGKSRLLEAAAELASSKGMTVATGRADELDQISPWLSLASALTCSHPAILDRAATQAAPERLDQRGAVLEAFRDALERAAERGPLIVLLDDLQWADPSTIAALGWLPEQLFSYPIVWLLARRPLPTSSSLDALVTRLDKLGACHLYLAPLDEDAAVALAADIAGGPIDTEARDLLLATGGNPLFIVEAMRPHRPGGVPFPPPSDSGDRNVPALSGVSLQAVVEAHLRSLSPPTVELLKVASVLGHEFSVAEVDELTGRPTAQLLPAIEEAITGGVLAEASGQLSFCHDVFREVLYSSIPGSLRRSLHGEAAGVLRRNGASATRMAHQLIIGAEAGDPDAIASLYQAVAELVGTSPWPAADLALRLVELTPPDTEERTSAVSMAVQLLGWAGRTEEARALGESFLQDTPVPPVTEAEILTGLLRAWLMRHVRPYPRPLPPRVLEDPAIPAGVRATLLTFAQVGALLNGRLADADAALEEAASLLAGAGSDLEATSVRPLWILSAHLRGEFLLASERAHRDLRVVGPSSEAAAVAATEADVAICLGGLGRIQDGLATVERGVQAAEACGYPYIQFHCRGRRAAFYLDAGRLDDARAEAAAVSEAAMTSGYLTLATLAFTTLVESSLRIGDLGAAEAALESLLGVGERHALLPDPYWATAIVAEANGRGAATMRALEPVFAYLGEDNFAIAAWHPGRLPQIANIAMRQGRDEAARTVAVAAARLARANAGVPVLEQIALHTQGLVEHDSGLLRQAYELSQVAETRLLHAVLTEHLGVSEAEGGHRVAAVTALEEAFTSFSDMGALMGVSRVRAELRKLGVRKRQAASARPDRGWASLTPAELSVVRVVGKGRTNRVAAEELCVSADTVNTHLRHAFTKLDIRSRAELARVVASHDG